MLLGAAFMLCVGFVGCDRMAAVVLLTFCLGAAGIVSSGITVNHLDLAPRFAS